jgi:3-oxoadipate enol-lactonase
VKLAHRVDGPDGAPVLVLSGGLGTTTTMWDGQVAAFAERYRVLRHDQPGHGTSPLPDAPVTIEGIARELLAVLDSLGVQRASFCGLSMGGMVGMWLAANATDRIERVVLACTGATLGTVEMFAERAALVRREGLDGVAVGSRERWFTPRFRHTPAADRVIDELRNTPREGYAACCEAVGNFDFTAELQRVTQPTLVVTGAEDPVTPPQVIDTLLDGIRGSTHVTLDPAAHLANVEQPDAFNAAVLRHLEERAAA